MAALAAINSSRATNPGGSPNEEAAATKIAPWVVEHTANGAQAEFMVVLADQADLSWAAAMRTRTDKLAAASLQSEPALDGDAADVDCLSRADVGVVDWRQRGHAALPASRR